MRSQIKQNNTAPSQGISDQKKYNHDYAIIILEMNLKFLIDLSKEASLPNTHYFLEKSLECLPLSKPTKQPKKS